MPEFSTAGTSPDYGHSEAYLAELGRLTTEFSELTFILEHTIKLVLGISSEFCDCITCEMSFDRLVQLLSSLFQEVERRDGVKCEELRPLLKDALNAASTAEQTRNRVIHSNWGYTPDYEFVRIKITAKKKDGLKYGQTPTNVAAMMADVQLIREAKGKLWSFVHKYYASYDPTAIGLE
jgi:hypothetical protein